MYVSDSTPTRLVDNGRVSLFTEHYHSCILWHFPSFSPKCHFVEISRKFHPCFLMMCYLMLFNLMIWALHVDKWGNNEWQLSSWVYNFYSPHIWRLSLVSGLLALGVISPENDNPRQQRITVGEIRQTFHSEKKCNMHPPTHSCYFKFVVHEMIS